MWPKYQESEKKTFLLLEVSMKYALLVTLNLQIAKCVKKCRLLGRKVSFSFPFVVSNQAQCILVCLGIGFSRGRG